MHNNPDIIKANAPGLSCVSVFTLKWQLGQVTSLERGPIRSSIKMMGVLWNGHRRILLLLDGWLRLDGSGRIVSSISSNVENTSNSVWSKGIDQRPKKKLICSWVIDKWNNWRLIRLFLVATCDWSMRVSKSIDWKRMLFLFLASLDVVLLESLAVEGYLRWRE